MAAHTGTVRFFVCGPVTVCREAGRVFLPGWPDKSISVQYRELIHCTLPVMRR